MTAAVASVRLAAVAALFVIAAAPRPAAQMPPGERFDLVATLPAPSGAGGSLTIPITIQLDRFTPEFARTAMLDALRYNGYPGFLRALREAPPVGSLQVGQRKITIRWAREEPDGASRSLSFVTESPVYFVGSNLANAKPKAGYELAVVQLTMDASGSGKGVIAAAARVKRRGDTGVQVDDYAEKPVNVTATAARAAKH